MDEQQGPELFDAGRIIGPEGPHGVVVRAAVISDELRSEIGPAVAVKIVPVGDRAVGALRAAVRHAMHESAHSGLVRYHGVWPGPGGEAWIVSDLCENRSVAEVLHAARIVDPRELERVVAYVLRNALLAVDAVHAASSVHGDIRGNNFLIDGKGRVKLADYGVFHILESAMRSRTTYPGARLWPAPELSRMSSDAYTAASEIWAIGIAAMELVEGRASVQRMHQASVARRRAPGAASASAGQTLPTLRDPSRWSSALVEFIRSACAPDAERRPSAAALLNSPFVALADGRALAAAIDVVSALPTPPWLQGMYRHDDVVATLYRRNNCVRAPLIDLDALNAEDFIDSESQAQGDVADRPAVELALRTALRNRMRDDAIGLNRGPDDPGGIESDATLERLAVFIDTIDMSARRSR